ncbi:unnamed protein product [Urochloa decumbens]|uniref:Osmotin-like protein n=1 Tax=Urochloa decumbens TaxID=240449 RepID=A0ABC9B3W5_9POAL
MAMSSLRKTQEPSCWPPLAFLALAVLAAVAAADDASYTNLTLHNLCPYPAWPLVTANTGFPAIADPDGAATRLDAGGAGLATLAFPVGAWSGRVVARTGCTAVGGPLQCETGDAPPATVAQVSVGGPGGLAAYSVSLVDGFNVPMVVSPHGFAAGKLCPVLGCAVDLAAECPAGARVPGGGCGAGSTEAGLFKAMCPETRTTVTDVEATPQDCIAPGELKVVFCPTQDSVAGQQ